MNTSKQRPVRVAIIGLGWWGQKMVSILKSCGTELEIVCAVEPNPAAGDFCFLREQWIDAGRELRCRPCPRGC
jgi:predicted dehydrogenase